MPETLGLPIALYEQQRLHSRENLEYRFIRSNEASSWANSWRNGRPLNLKG
jgi:hypothetical protein